MSALSSGFEGAEGAYRVINPTTADLGGPAIGSCYQQKADICWMPNRVAEIWVVTDIGGDTITLQPNKARWVRGPRSVLLSVLNTEYRLCRHQRQNPGC